ncbi:MAG: molybdate ABC transporter substrate-binding protein [Deltaproteobacteria bacterium]|nr:molybdate ABC transporter substrate-binding protein [Deltaproteobacteria bacterium]
MNALRILIVIVTLLINAQVYAENKSLLVFAGSASKPPTEEAAKVYESKTGVKVDLLFGGSGYVLSQMMLAKKGDLYFPGSSDFMETAKKKGAVYNETERKVVYLVPAINVRKGNPKNIRKLGDLTAPGLRVAIARPDTVCVGLYAVEIIENNLAKEQIKALRKNIVNYTESCEKTATTISLHTADAVLGWSVFQYWDPERIETVNLAKEEISRVGYIPIAVSRYTKDRGAAQKFIDFILSDEGKAIFRKYHYFMSPEEAYQYIGAPKPVGGEYSVPAAWINE